MLNFILNVKGEFKLETINLHYPYSEVFFFEWNYGK